MDPKRRLLRRVLSLPEDPREAVMSTDDPPPPLGAFDAERVAAAGLTDLRERVQHIEDRLKAIEAHLGKHLRL